MIYGTGWARRGREGFGRHTQTRRATDITTTSLPSTFLLTFSYTSPTISFPYYPLPLSLTLTLIRPSISPLALFTIFHPHYPLLLLPDNSLFSHLPFWPSQILSSILSFLPLTSLSSLLVSQFHNFPQTPFSIPYPSHDSTPSLLSVSPFHDPVYMDPLLALSLWLVLTQH